jgi:NTP pyrophosphatase (non-canonical NTP hydrolase)
MKTLRQLLSIQYRASTEVNGGPPRPTRHALAQYAFALVTEVGELMQLLNWKPWKKDRPTNKAEVLDELADVWAFTLLLTNLVMDAVDASAEDVEAAYLKKTQVNLIRARGEVPDYGRKELQPDES